MTSFAFAGGHDDITLHTLRNAARIAQRKNLGIVSIEEVKDVAKESGIVRRLELGGRVSSLSPVSPIVPKC